MTALEREIHGMAHNNSMQLGNAFQPTRPGSLGLVGSLLWCVLSGCAPYEARPDAPTGSGEPATEEPQDAPKGGSSGSP